jgi:hypothetical protein
MLFSATGSHKLGHPVPDSNLTRDVKSAVSPAHAPVDAVLLVVIVFADSAHLGAGAAGHAVLLGCELLPPFGVRLHNLVD